MLSTILGYVFMFFAYSAVGWTIESIYCSVGNRKIINRGFLYGPICPIYGTGALVFEICVAPFSVPFAQKFWVVLLLGMVLADTVEYITSFLMEKLFHARWWDYSENFMNLHGRICLKHTCYWGIFALIYVYLIRPVYTFLTAFIPPAVQTGITVAVLVVFLFDFILTLRAALDIKKLMTKIEALKLNINSAAEAVKIAAESIRGSAESKYENIHEQLVLNGKKLSDWKNDAASQFSDIRVQFEELSARQKSSHYGKRAKRLFSPFLNLRSGADKALKELEQAWDDIKAKFTDDNDEMM